MFDPFDTMSDREFEALMIARLADLEDEFSRLKSTLSATSRPRPTGKQ